MAGLRVGYAIVPDGGPDLAPVLGVGAPALARRAVGGRERRASRRAAGATQADAQRARLAAEFAGRRRASGPTPGWRCRSAEELAARRIYVAPGLRVGRRAARPRHAARRRRDRPAARGAARATALTSRASLVQYASSVPPERWSWLGEPLAVDFANTVRRRGGDYTELLGQRRRSARLGGARGEPRPGPVGARRRRAPDEVRELRDAIFALLLAAARASRRRSASSSASTRRWPRSRSSRSCATARSSSSPRRRRPARRAAGPRRRRPRSSCSPPPRSRTATPRAAASSSCAAAATSAGAARPAAPARGSRGTLCGSDDLARRS